MPTATGTQVSSQTQVGQFYRPELDLLRFVAFGLVFLAHALPMTLPQGLVGNHAYIALIHFKQACNFGVCLFFLLSSFLITALLLREKEEYGRIHVRAFYIRRVLRIWPLYFVFVIAIYTIGLWFHPWQIAFGRLSALLLLCGNWYYAWYGWGLSAPFGALWSISVEEQFYLVWPAVIEKGTRLLTWVAVATLPIGIFTIERIASTRTLPGDTIWFNSFVQFMFFGSGALCAVFLEGNRFRQTPVRSLNFFAAGLVLWWIAAWGTKIKSNPTTLDPLGAVVGYVLVDFGCVCLLIAALALPRRYVTRPFIYLGRISYGLYIFHSLCLNVSERATKELPHAYLLSRMVAIVLTVVAATLSYELFEKKWLALKKRYEFVRTRPV